MISLFRMAVMVLGAMLMLSFSAGAQAPDQAAYVPTVLITGANRGIGLEFVRQYADLGWHVIATARKPQEAGDLNAIAAKNPLVVVEQLDVQDFSAVDALALKYKEQPIDLLLHNAGISGGAAAQNFTKIDYEVWNDVFLTNSIAPLKISEAFYPQILASQQKKICTVSSSEGSIAGATQARLYFYRASKAAVNMVMKNLSVQLKRKGVSVCLLNPGPTDTDFMAGLPKKMLRPTALAVTEMIANVDRLNLENSGSFWQYDGTIIPW